MTETKSHSLVRSGLRLSVVTLLSRILGLVREMTKAAFLGTGAIADAFGIAFQLPNLFRRLFAENSVSVAFIPTFRAYVEDISSDADRKKNTGFYLIDAYPRHFFDGSGHRFGYRLYARDH